MLVVTPNEVPSTPPRPSLLTPPPATKAEINRELTAPVVTGPRPPDDTFAPGATVASSRKFLLLSGSERICSGRTETERSVFRGSTTGAGASTTTSFAWMSFPVKEKSTMTVCPTGNCTPLFVTRSEEHTSELQSRLHLLCRL